MAFSPSAFLSADDEDRSRPPNVLIFVADDVDWQDFGCYGNEVIRTPHIDDLARRGLRCEQAILTTPQCSPTRISLLTGRYAHTVGAEDLHTPLPDGELFVSTYLQRAGYFTGHMQKTHYGPNGNRQFEWYSKQLEDFDQFLDAAGERPFFLWVGFRDAHRPYEPGAVDPPHDPATVRVPPHLADTPETREDLALYYDEIRRLDGVIGSCVAELERRELLDDTLIVFFGDNGAPFPRAKGTLYDAGIRTPLVFCWPRVIDSGQVYGGLVSLIDLAPTILEVAGIERPEAMQGQSILAALGDPSLPGRPFAFSERNWHDCDEHLRSVRSERYKLIRNAYLDKPYGNPGDVLNSPSWKSLLALREADRLTPLQEQVFRVPRPEIELYDLARDPWESKNLADDSAYAEVRGELIAALDAWCEATGDFPPEQRRRDDIVDRLSGEWFSRGQLPPLQNTESP